MRGRIRRAGRWVDRHYRMGLWVLGLSGYVAGVEATGWPSAARAGLIAAGTLFGGSEVFVNLINNKERDREHEEMRGKMAEYAGENAKLREERVQWREENAKLREERDQLRRERARMRRGRYRRNRGAGLNGGGGE